jgi:palmitoyltransferase ZDHHC2/15/20
LYLSAVLAENNNRPDVYYWQTEEERSSATIRSIVASAVLTFCMLMLFISFYQAARTDPGEIPKSGEWEILLEESSDSENDKLAVEKRRDGSIRTCNHCQMRKPDRCHHCKQCDRCILKMDHHCNWIANCVGNNNYKYFFLLIFYAVASLGIFVGTFWEVVCVTLCDDNGDEAKALFIATVYSLMVLLLLTLSGFLFFHLYLLYKNYTTIEFCEKKRAKHANFLNSPYSLSPYSNFKQVLGSSPFFWLLPFNLSPDSFAEDGLHFSAKQSAE